MRRNDEVARLLKEYADLLEARDVEYKPRSYRRAAENIRDYPADVAALASEGAEAVAEIDAVGDAISAKVVEYVETGSIEELAELREELPVEMDALTRVEGVGPKTVRTLYAELEVQTLDDLEAVAEAGEIRELKGFGPKTEENILAGIDFAREAHERQLLGTARPLGDEVVDYLDAQAGIERVALAGSIRRWKPTIGDVDVLVASDEPEAAVAAFTDWESSDTVIEAGPSKASLRVDEVRVDLRVVEFPEYGAALQYFTGSKDHNVALRNRAIDRDLKMNEYGVFDVADVEDPDAGQRVGKRIAGETEEGMYDALDLDWIPPELRGNRGEIAAAAAGDLPDLVETTTIRGDLHLHTDWSDGRYSLAEMVEGAQAVGHEYVAITDHATGPGMVGGVGLEDEEIREQLSAVRAVDDEFEIDVLPGIEANVDAEGGLSVADDVLADLDLVIASPHSGLDGDGTDRLVTAAEHAAVDVIGHPTGRFLDERQGLELDVERLAGVCADEGVALEVNANPRRLDLGGRAVKTAIETGATIAINTDAHAPSSLDYLRYGVHTARRGWAETGDVLNANPIEAFRELLH